MVENLSDEDEEEGIEEETEQDEREGGKGKEKEEESNPSHQVNFKILLSIIFSDLFHLT